jgi:hypothetical protein
MGMIMGFLVVVPVIMIVGPMFPGMEVCMLVLVSLVAVLVAVLVKVLMCVDVLVFVGMVHFVMLMLVFMLVGVLVLVLMLVFMFSFHDFVSFPVDEFSISGFLFEQYFVVHQTERPDLTADRLLFTEDTDQPILIRFFRLNDVHRLHDQLFSPIFHKICIGFTHAKNLLNSLRWDQDSTTHSCPGTCQKKATGTGRNPSAVAFVALSIDDCPVFSAKGHLHGANYKIF